MVTSTLNDNLAILYDYFYKQRLKHNSMKTVVRINRVAYEELEVVFNGVKVLHSFKPKYPRIPLHRLLTFKEHIKKTTKKFCSRINLI